MKSTNNASLGVGVGEVDAGAVALDGEEGGSLLADVGVGVEPPAAQVGLGLAGHGEVADLARLDLDLALGVHRLPRLLQLEVGGGDGRGALVQLVGKRERPSALLFSDVVKFHRRN